VEGRERESAGRGREVRGKKRGWDWSHHKLVTTTI